MLFLAVFCGFFAEYQLEHKIEKDRAKELLDAADIPISARAQTLSLDDWHALYEVYTQSG